MTPDPRATRIHRLASALLDTPQGYLERSLAECTEAELEMLSRAIARARMDREMVFHGDPLPR